MSTEDPRELDSKEDAAADEAYEGPPEVQEDPDSVVTPRLGPLAGVEGLAELSRGSVGHPGACSPACKYIRKRKGCKDGADCSHCHLCVWHSHRARFTRP